MLYNKIFLYFTFAVFSLMIITSAEAQEIPDDYGDQNESIIDSIDMSENLLDSNQVYKKQFDSLSKDGEWVEAKKSDLIRDLNNLTGEELDFDYSQTNEVVYVWRPYGINTNWNPYYNGRWIFTSYGWIWSSYYSWGWGPYNYGRWYCSNYYGWIWFPGIRWAPNWVTWRNCNNYVGWYPSCPRFYWRAGNRVCTNRLFASVPKNWVFVDKRDFTKKIDNTTVVSAVNNSRLIKNSEKVNTAVYSDPSGPKIKYSGPDVNIISKESGEKITPKQITVIKSDGKNYSEVKYNNSNSNNEINTSNFDSKNSDTKTQTEKSNQKKSNKETEVKKTKEGETKANSTYQDNKKESKKDYNDPPTENSDVKKSTKENKSKEKVKNNSENKEKSKSKTGKKNNSKGNNKKSKSNNR